MTKQKLCLMFVLCCSLSFFPVRTKSETDDPNQKRKSTNSEDTLDWDMIVQERMKAYEEFCERLRKIDEQRTKWREEFNERTRGLIGEQKIRAIKQRQREDDKFDRQYKLARDQWWKELAKLGEGPLVSRQQKSEIRSKKTRENSSMKSMHSE